MNSELNCLRASCFKHTLVINQAASLTEYKSQHVVKFVAALKDYPVAHPVVLMEPDSRPNLIDVTAVR